MLNNEENMVMMHLAEQLASCQEAETGEKFDHALNNLHVMEKFICFAHRHMKGIYKALEDMQCGVCFDMMECVELIDEVRPAVNALDAAESRVLSLITALEDQGISNNE